jgi:hypothetical protein
MPLWKRANNSFTKFPNRINRKNELKFSEQPALLVKNILPQNAQK